MGKLPEITIPGPLCRNAIESIRREWLVTNGIGGFASGTVAGALTRRYHGLLVAALRPPLGRTMLASKLDETVFVDGAMYPLCTNIWTTGVEAPAGCERIEQFDLVGGAPTWRFAVAGCTLTKCIWMEHGCNTTYVRYSLDPDAARLTLSTRLFVNYRDYHALSRPDDWQMDVAAEGASLRVRAFESAVPLLARVERGVSEPVCWEPDHTWYRKFYLPVEAERGYGHLEDHLSVGCCAVALEPGTDVTFLLAAGAEPELCGLDAHDRQERRAMARLDTWRRLSPAVPRHRNQRLEQLVLAAHQFIVRRPIVGAADGYTLIAGYPWFSDWGRDTMVALPGLTLTTGRSDIARAILLTWARYVNEGLIPNRFPDEGDRPEYHTADATLWYLWAIDQYARATHDLRTLAELYPVVQEIIAWHQRGTRHNIHIADDGLFACGQAGLNLTWMDAKIGDRVITPRMGKPIELSALWYNALMNLARWAELLGKDASEYMEMAATTRAAFKRFWNPDRQACFDVIDGPHGVDGRIQANQIFAVALDHSPLDAAQQQAVVAVCERDLLTPGGLRTLAQGEPGYHGHYVGNQTARDEAYHTGTVWGWLLGPFVLAHYRVYRNRARARALLEPIINQLLTYCVGSLSEVCDGDMPHTPNGALAQAWTVGETLRAWHITQAENGTIS
ncbi:MAG: glycogen debranching enzyme family protein [Phycisphaerae bacterium]|nr:glycogen debranching enzyme family protein [Phycisphaerae bacterium]